MRKVGKRPSVARVAVRGDPPRQPGRRPAGPTKRRWSAARVGAWVEAAATGFRRSQQRRGERH